MAAEHPPECLQRLDPFARLLEFYLKQVAHLPAGCSTTTGQECSGLIKRKAHLLGLFNEPQALYRLTGKQAEPAFRPRWERQQFPLFVIPNRVNADPGLSSYLADAKPNLSHKRESTLWSRV